MTSKPWYLWRPVQVLHRARAALFPPSAGHQMLRTSWGGALRADPTKAIGRAILHTGIHDLLVSEVLARLLAPGDVAVDAGANVGHMTLLAAVAVGPRGRVTAFEPHPRLFTVLRSNIEAFSRQWQIAPVTAHEVALGEHEGRAALVMPHGFDANDGIARCEPGRHATSDELDVRVASLDQYHGTDTIDVLKVDVEGFELQVLRGATNALAEGRVRHVLIEEHCPGGSECATFLAGLGYHVFQLSQQWHGPRVAPLPVEHIFASGATALLVATREHRELRERLRSPGWCVLRASYVRARVGAVKEPVVLAS